MFQKGLFQCANSLLNRLFFNCRVLSIAFLGFVSLVVWGEAGEVLKEAGLRDQGTITYFGWNGNTDNGFVLAPQVDLIGAWGEQNKGSYVSIHWSTEGVPPPQATHPVL